MQNNYVIKNKNDELISFYYGENRTIYCERLNENNYRSKICVADSVIDTFTVSINNIDDIHIICQNTAGEVMLCESNGGTFKNRTIFKNKNSLAENVKFYPIFKNTNMSLIYNTPLREQSDNFITIRTLIGNENWTNSENIDTFSGVYPNLFSLYNINNDDFVLSYCKNARDTQLGFKQIKNTEISDFMVVHRTGYQIVDYSLVEHNGTIHFVYIIKSLFSSQVIYRKKDSLGISSPLLIFEGQKIKNCVISVINSTLYCKFLIGNFLYYSQSEDNGVTFGQVSKYKRTLSSNIVKATFITNSKNINNSLNNSLNEIFIDAQNTLNIQFLPEFYPTFLNKNNSTNDPFDINTSKFISNLNNQFNDIKDTKKEIEPIQKVKPMIQESPKNTKMLDILENDFMSNFDVEKLQKIAKSKNNIKTTSKNDTLDDTVKLLKNQLSDKNNEISKLNDLVKNSKSEIQNIQEPLEQKINELTEKLRSYDIDNTDNIGVIEE